MIRRAGPRAGARIVAVLLSLLAGPPGLASIPLDRLAWLEGTWVGTDDGAAMEETWSSPAGGGMVGMHKDTRGGRMISCGFFRIIQDSSRVCYLASPLGRAAVPFYAIELGDSAVVFENLEHDFPQRIIYRLGAEGRLHARIEGIVEGKTRSEAWVWTRRSGR